MHTEIEENLKIGKRWYPIHALGGSGWPLKHKPSPIRVTMPNLVVLRQKVFA